LIQFHRQLLFTEGEAALDQSTDAIYAKLQGEAVKWAKGEERSLGECPSCSTDAIRWSLYYEMQNY
jgi:hypothetical protein